MTATHKEIRKTIREENTSRTHIREANSKIIHNSADINWDAGTEKALSKGFNFVAHHQES